MKRSISNPDPNCGQRTWVLEDYHDYRITPDIFGALVDYAKRQHGISGLAAAKASGSPDSHLVSRFFNNDGKTRNYPEMARTALNSYKKLGAVKGWDTIEFIRKNIEEKSGIKAHPRASHRSRIVGTATISNNGPDVIEVPLRSGVDVSFNLNGTVLKLHFLPV